MVACLRQRTRALECKFEVGVGIPIPDNSSSYATLSSVSALPADVDALPGLPAFSQVRSHGHGQDPPPPPVPIDFNADDFEDDWPLYITYAKTVRQSRMAPVGPHGKIFRRRLLHLRPLITTSRRRGPRSRRRGAHRYLHRSTA